MSDKRTFFSTRLGVLAATVGSAVGLGNIWRFPYEAGTHGGGAFLLCYIFFVFLIGVPVICAEFAMGRRSRTGIPGAFQHLNKGRGGWNWIGWIGIAGAVMIISFYSVVAGWTLEYTIDSAVGMFSDHVQHNRHAEFLAFTQGWKPSLWVVVFMGINGLVLLGGVQKGIERVSNILMPLLFLILLAFCINSLLLPGAGEGLRFLFNPDFSQLTPSVILGAMGQAFFSLSLGMGCMITYASYFKDDTPLMKTSIQIATLDTLVAILSGVIIFPAVFSFGMSPAEGPTLVFEVLPNIFQQMSGGRIWSTLFFLLLAVASLTSLISVSEIAIAFFVDHLKMKRPTATLTVTLVGTILGVLCALSFGPLKNLDLFNAFDYISSNILLPLGGMSTSIFAGWVLKRSTLYAELQGKGKLPRAAGEAIVISLRWIAPACVLAVFIAGLVM